MDTLECIRTRRSTRAYADAPLDERALNAVIEAGRYAPSGGNNQTTRLIVITNRQTLNELAGLVRAEFAKMDTYEGMYASLAHSITASKAGAYVFHYNAPALIVTANRRDYGNAMADCACVLENMMLAANALDLGSCWINQLRWLDENPAVRACLEALGLSPDERVCGALAVGYARTEDGLPNRAPLPRKGNPVTWVK